MKQRILVCGDIHGRDLWKTALFGSNQHFDWWRNEYELGIHKEFDYPINTFDKVVFIGDYTDSFTITNVEILHNLREIILVKNAYPDKIHLLVGNHDIQYIYGGQPKYICSGFRTEMVHDLRYEFNTTQFDLAYGIDNILFTHAGVINNWHDSYLKNLGDRYDKFIDGTEPLWEKLNILYQTNFANLFDVSYERKGSSPFGGPLWAGKEEMELDYLKGYLQIVGHTATDEIEMYINNNDGVIFIDTVGVGQFLILEIEDGKIDFDYFYLK